MKSQTGTDGELFKKTAKIKDKQCSAMNYIGDLSQQDAQILASYAGSANRILEFGVGASTQIFAQCAPPGATLTSVDTSKDWIEKTRAHFDTLRITRPVTYLLYDEWLGMSEG